MTDAISDTAPGSLPPVAGAPADDATGAPAWWRQLRWRLVPPFVAALVLQVLLVRGDQLPGIDALAYFESGRNLLNGDGYVRYGSPELHFPPVVPVSLAVLERLLGGEMAALRTWNVAWALATIAVLVALARTLVDDDDVAVATAWFAALVPGITVIAVGEGGGSELPAACLVLVSALIVLRSPGRPWRTVGAGAVLGVGYLVRPEVLLPGAAVGVAAMALAWARANPEGRRAALRAAAVAAVAFGAAFVLVIAPYLVHRHGETGSWSITSKAQDASIESWRDVAKGNRLGRDRILYEIQPDGVTLGPETVPLTSLIRQDPDAWFDIIGINLGRIRDGYLERVPGEWAWTLLPPFLLLPALVQVVRGHRRATTRLLVAIGLLNLVTNVAYFTLARYLILTTAVLLPFAAWGLVLLLRLAPRPLRIAAWVALVALTASSFRIAGEPLLPGAEQPERTLARTTGEWIDEHAPDDARIMTRSYQVQGYAERPVVAWPSAEWPETLEFARRLGVTHVVADRGSLRARRPEVFDLFFGEDAPEAPDGLRLVHELDDEDGTTRVRIFELDPPAPPTDLPPIPLGYVSDRVHARNATDGG